MKLEEIIRHYISPVKRFDYTLGNNYTAADIFNYYRTQVLLLLIVYRGDLGPC